MSKQNVQKMSLQEYYNTLKNLDTEFRDKVCDALEISRKTFYNKLNDNSWDYPQQLVIAQIAGKAISFDEVESKAS